MADKPSPPQSEQPRSEPEIFPPGARVRPSRTDPLAESVFVQRVYVTRLGPFGMFLLALAIGIVAVLLLVLLVGALLFWIPIVGLLIAAAIFSGALRSRFQRHR
jgi:hypothetical protein